MTFKDLKNHAVMTFKNYLKVWVYSIITFINFKKKSIKVSGYAIRTFKESIKVYPYSKSHGFLHTMNFIYFEQLFLGLYK